MTTRSQTMFQCPNPKMSQRVRKERSGALGEVSEKQISSSKSFSPFSGTDWHLWREIFSTVQRWTAVKEYLRAQLFFWKVGSQMG